MSTQELTEAVRHSRPQTGNACITFGGQGHPNTIGFRYKFIGKGGDIANGESMSKDMTWDSVKAVIKVCGRALRRWSPSETYNRRSSQLSDQFIPMGRRQVAQVCRLDRFARNRLRLHRRALPWPLLAAVN